VSCSNMAIEFLERTFMWVCYEPEWSRMVTRGNLPRDLIDKLVVRLYTTSRKHGTCVDFRRNGQMLSIHSWQNR